MLKKITKSLLITVPFVSPVFADDILSSFHKQGDINYSEPIAEESYFATKAAMESQIFRHVGLNLGVGIASLGSSVTVNTVSGDQNNKSLIYDFGLYGGAGINWQHLYLGIELGATYNVLNKTINNAVNGHSTTLNVKKPLFGYLDFMPGYINYAKDFLLYGRLGMGVSWFKLSFTDATNGGNSSQDNINFGWRAGLGMEYFWNPDFSWRAEYVYIRHREASNVASATTYKLKASGTNQINLGLTIYF